jgi:hypothetical protein
MSVDNAQFYGIGKGGAQIINTQPLLADYAQAMARQQAQRQAELKQLADKQSSLKSDGMRDADLKDYVNGYNDWRSKATAAMNEKDPYKKAVLQSDADKAYNQVSSLVGESKQQLVKDNQMHQFLMNDATRHQLTDDAVNKALKNFDTPLSHPDFIGDYSSLERAVDHKKIMDELDKGDQALLKQTPFGTPTIIRKKIGNRMATFTQNSRTVDPKDRADYYSQLYDSRPDIKKFFNDIYPDLFTGADPKAAKQAAIQKYIDASGDVSEYHAPVEKVDPQPDNFYAHKAWEMQHGLAGTQYTPAQTMLINQAQTGDFSKLKTLIPKGQYGDKQPNIYIDPKTGEHVFEFPAHVEPNKKNIEANTLLRNKYAKNPDKQGAILGFGGEPIPFEQSSKASKLLPETTVKVPAKTYRLNPNDPNYLSAAVPMATEQNINLSKLNQMESVKGGHGVIPEAKHGVKGKKSAANYGL